MIGYWLKGLWVPAVTHYFLLSLPVVVPAILLGKVVNYRLRGETFLKYVYSGLAVIGVILLAQACGRLS